MAALWCLPPEAACVTLYLWPCRRRHVRRDCEVRHQPHGGARAETAQRGAGRACHTEGAHDERAQARLDGCAGREQRVNKAIPRTSTWSRPRRAAAPDAGLAAEPRTRRTYRKIWGCPRSPRKHALDFLLLEYFCLNNFTVFTHLKNRSEESSELVIPLSRWDARVTYLSAELLAFFTPL